MRTRETNTMKKNAKNQKEKFQIVLYRSKTCDGGSTGYIYETEEEALKDYDLFSWCRTKSKYMHSILQENNQMMIIIMNHFE